MGYVNVNRTPACSGCSSLNEINSLFNDDSHIQLIINSMTKDELHTVINPYNNIGFPINGMGILDVETRYNSGNKIRVAKITSNDGKTATATFRYVWDDLFKYCIGKVIKRYTYTVTTEMPVTTIDDDGKTRFCNYYAPFRNELEPVDSECYVWFIPKEPIPVGYKICVEICVDDASEPVLVRVLDSSNETVSVEIAKRTPYEIYRGIYTSGSGGIEGDYDLPEGAYFRADNKNNIVYWLGGSTSTHTSEASVDYIKMGALINGISDTYDNIVNTEITIDDIRCGVQNLYSDKYGYPVDSTYVFDTEKLKRAQCISRYDTSFTLSDLIVMLRYVYPELCDINIPIPCIYNTFKLSDIYDVIVHIITFLGQCEFDSADGTRVSIIDNKWSSVMAALQYAPIHIMNHSISDINASIGTQDYPFVLRRYNTETDLRYFIVPRQDGAVVKEVYFFTSLYCESHGTYGNLDGSHYNTDNEYVIVKFDDGAIKRLHLYTASGFTEEFGSIADSYVSMAAPVYIEEPDNTFGILASSVLAGNAYKWVCDNGWTMS